MLKKRHTLLCFLLGFIILLVAVFTRSTNPAKRSGSSITFDFDAPRSGEVCIAVDNSDTIKFVWKGNHNLYRMPDAKSFRSCNFSGATELANAMPNPTGRIVSRGCASSSSSCNSVLFFACSKICASNGHRVRVCVGGNFGETSACLEASDCTSVRTHDMRTKSVTEATRH